MLANLPDDVHDGVKNGEVVRSAVPREALTLVDSARADGSKCCANSTTETMLRSVKDSQIFLDVSLVVCWSRKFELRGIDPDLNFLDDECHLDALGPQLNSRKITTGLRFWRTVRHAEGEGR